MPSGSAADRTPSESRSSFIPWPMGAAEREAVENPFPWIARWSAGVTETAESVDPRGRSRGRSRSRSRSRRDLAATRARRDVARDAIAHWTRELVHALMEIPRLEARVGVRGRLEDLDGLDVGARDDDALRTLMWAWYGVGVGARDCAAVGAEVDADEGYTCWELVVTPRGLIGPRLFEFVRR